MRLSTLVLAAGIGAAVLAPAGPVTAQQRDLSATLATRPAGMVPPDTGGLPAVTALHALASAAVPGAGQLLGGRDRGALYAVGEALLLTRFLAFQAEGRRERQRFRDLAFTVARGPFSPMARDTAFEYFEEMGKFIESGPFDVDPGPALVPPTDERTFNGSMWALARETFFADPDSVPPPDSEAYQRAIAFYRDRAVGPNFRWSWRNAGLEQDLFRQSIRQSDEAFRRATQQLGLMLANHLLSALDAFITHRLSQNDRRLGVQAGFWSVPSAGGWSAVVGVGVEF